MVKMKNVLILFSKNSDSDSAKLKVHVLKMGEVCECVWRGV